MVYTLDQVDTKLKRFADKQGSEYFPLPVLLDYFQTAAYDFIGEKLKLIEKTQQIADEIKPLITPGNLAVIKDPNDATRYIAALPVKYFRLVAYDVLYGDGTKCRRADLITQAEYSTAVLNPNKRPTKHYPLILQENNLFQIDCGPDAVPASMKITFCKKPTIAKTNQKDKRIINLPDESIEQILLNTVTRLFQSTADQRTQSNYQLQEAFAKVLR